MSNQHSATQCVFGALVLGCTFVPALAALPEVPWSSGTGLVDMIDWQFPATLEVPSEYATIQEAVDAAVNGDTVLIAAGEYFENVVVIEKAISIKGDGLVELWPDDDEAIIAVSSTPEDQWVRLEGLTFHSIYEITLPEILGGGTFNWYLSDTRGVAILSAAVQISQCTFDGMGIAGADGDDEPGAAVAAAWAHVQLEQCRFDDCRATTAGAVYAALASVEMTYCVFENCQSDTDGGAVKFESADGEIVACSFLSNAAYSEGGAIALNQASPAITRCLFEDNTAAWGGAVYSEGSEGTASDPVVTDCQFHGLSAGEYGDLWYASSYSDPWWTGSVGCGGDDLIYGFTVNRGLNSLTEYCPVCPGDVTGDETIDVADLLDVLSHWGTADPISDLSEDGTVDTDDLIWLFIFYGDCIEIV
ncbi:MAG: right-handed parallel beta-helix repeat-containing protein [Phycisphaerales bacterium]|nr:right-handed parallel beta-helix repeat-containing protein [Phycisphaerales bacterium]